MIISAPLDNEFKEVSEELLGKQACPAAGQHAMGLAVSRGKEGVCVYSGVGEPPRANVLPLRGKQAFESLSGQEGVRGKVANF